MNDRFKGLINYFVKGFLVLAPLAISIYVIVAAISTVDNWINVNNIIGVDPRTGESRNIPGLGLLTVLVLVLGVGVLVTNVITEPIKNWIDRWLNKLPLLKFLYSSIKDITEAFVGEEKKFNVPILVALEDGTKRIGFLTQTDLTQQGIPDMVAVYFPFAYSFAGQVVLVSKDKIESLQMSAADAMKFVVSGGVSMTATTDK